MAPPEIGQLRYLYCGLGRCGNRRGVLYPRPGRALASGFQAGRELEVPDGPVLLLKDPAGNEIALLHAVRPGAAEAMAQSFREGREQAPQ